MKELLKWITTNGEWRRENPEGGKFDNPVHWYLKGADVIRFVNTLPDDKEIAKRLYDKYSQWATREARNSSTPYPKSFPQWLDKENNEKL